MLRIYSPSGHPNDVDKCVSSLDQIPFPSENRAGRFFLILSINLNLNVLPQFYFLVIEESQFFYIIFGGLYVFYCYIGQLRTDRKVLGGERGVGSAQDLEIRIELGSP